MIFKSPFPEIQIPECAFTPFILESAGKFGSKPALIDAPSGQTILYADLPRLVMQAARQLSRRGIRKGSVAAIYASNCPEYAIAFHAICLLGGIVTTVNPLYTSAELSSQLKDSNVQLVITSDMLMEKAKEAGRGDLITFEQLKVESHDTALPEVKIDPREDLAALPYSSGTTGFSKGVMLTHYNLVANILQYEAVQYQNEQDILLCVLPMFHIYGLTVIMNAGLYTGCTIVTMPRFDLEEYLGNVEKFRVTFAHVVPPIALALSKNPVVDRYDTSSLKAIFCAAAPLSTSVLQDCMNRMGCVVKQGYGMTEASPATHMCPEDLDKIKNGSVGVCVSNTECRIVDPATRQELGPHQEGEICIRGPQIMKGYLNKRDATAIAIDPDGWLHSGDIGYADEDGHFYVVDRLKELIKYKGFQVPPAELEAVLLMHPSVADAAVVPLVDEEAGEVPKAFVVRKGIVSEAEILSFVAARVAPYKKIRKVEFIEKIPKSPSGKILRRLLTTKTPS